MSDKKTKALFLDRDGIINVDSHYPSKPEQIQFRDGIFSLCTIAAEKGYLLIGITNQAGIAKGKFTVQDVENLHAWMLQQFKDHSLTLETVYFCPHHPDGTVEQYRQVCSCRKPEPGLVLKAVHEYNIDISTSLMVGDKVSDRIKLDGLRSVIVKSEYTSDGRYDVAGLEDIAAML